MYFKKLTIKNFRSFQDLSLDLHPGVNIFLGNNGQGKTNLLEALHFLAHGQSFRHGKGETFVRQQSLESPALVRADIDRGSFHDQVQMNMTERSKNFVVNGKKFATHALASRYPSVLFSPESLAAIKEGPEHRRQLVDEFLLCHSLRDGKWVAEFRNVLRSRNRVLKDFKLGRYSETQTQSLLDALDQIFLPTAAELSWARVSALSTIEPLLHEAVSFIAGQEFVDISVDYEISSQSAMDWEKDQIAEAIGNRSKSLRKAELESGVTLAGPHKHDVRFISGGKDARYFCSQGQQRAIILGFKMAQIMYHYTVFQVHPLLLLDDVLSELDPIKGANLLRFLAEVRSQILLTTTDISFPFDFGSKGLSVYRLNDGKIEALRNT